MRLGEKRELPRPFGWELLGRRVKKIDDWINKKVGWIRWYNKMLIIGLVFFAGMGIRRIWGMI